MADFKITTTKEKITAARIRLLLKHEFFGTLATRLVVHEVDWCNTLCTDGRHIYFNSKFMDRLSFEQIEFCIAHEILHLVYDHIERGKHLIHRIHDAAADYCCNGLLIREGIGIPPDIQIYHEPDYYDKTSEEIYELIKDQELDKLGQMLDEHIDFSKDDPNNPNRPKLSKEEIEAIKRELTEAIISAAQTASHLPGEISNIINRLTTPMLNWREVLRAEILSTIKSDFSWDRFSKKAASQGIYLPSVRNDMTIDVCIALDYSGSCNDAIRDFLSEVAGIMDQFTDFNIKLFSFDTNVYNEQDFGMHNADELSEYMVTGGGGTDFMCIWDYLIEQDIQPKKLIVFTDMYPCGSWGLEDYCNTIFVAHNTDIEAPFGITVKYSSDV